MKKVILIILGLIFIIVVAGIIGAEYYTSRPQFCGSCHIMKKHYNQYTNDKHAAKNVVCVDCHYAPGEKLTPHAKFKGLGQLFSYLATKDEIVQKKAKVPDFSCTASNCHPQNEEFLNKKIKFTEKISYVHKSHFEKQIEGQALHCDTCHQHVSSDRHFEVPRTICYLCHFKNTKFNEERAKCSLCHEIPTKSLQKKQPEPGAKLITHQTLEKDKVPCYSCHYVLVQGKSNIKKENCFNCHDYSAEMLKKAEDKKLMHENHVASQEAHCFECHEPIQHSETDFLDPARLNCQGCHSDHHISQKVLLAGPATKDVSETPSLMFSVKTTCFGCHQVEKIVKGEKVLHGDPQACARCHVEKTAQMVDEWKKSIDKAMKEAKELEKEAKEAIAKAKDKASAGKLKEASRMFKEAQKNVQLVEAGGGVHNQKYSIQLLDAAMNNFDEVISLLE